MIFKRTEFSWGLFQFSLILALIFVIYVVLFIPFRYPFEFNSDEGLQLIRGFLINQGYELYTDIPSDQPPIFPLILSAVGLFVSNKVFLARLIVVAFSALIILSVSAFIQNVWGRFHAALSLIFLMMTPRFIELSVSVMVGIPAIALASFSLFLLLAWHRTRKAGWLILSGITFALSLMTKLFTGILVPIMAAGIILSAIRNRKTANPWHDIFKATLTWSVPLLLLVALFLLSLVKPTNIGQLFISHTSALDVETYINLAETENINYFLTEAWGMILLGLVGTIIAILRKNWISFYLSAWAGLAYAFLSILRPVWFHHQMLVTVPIAGLVSITIGELCKEIWNSHKSKQLITYRAMALSALLVATFIILMPRFQYLASNLNSEFSNLTRNQSLISDEYTILAVMSNYSTEDNLVVTDRPMFPYRLDMPIPPELAVFSEKRLFTGGITEREVLNSVTRRKPTQVLFGRFSLPLVEQYVNENYELAHVESGYRLFVRSDLFGQIE